VGFFEELAEREAREALGSGSQNDTTGQCAFCGLAGDDVVIGVCKQCEPCTCPKVPNGYGCGCV